MKSHHSLLLISSLAAALPAFAADTGKPSAPIPMTQAVLSDPQVTGLFQVLKPDGTTVIQQAVVSAGSTAIGTINVAASDALVASNGRCAFNVRYNELSQIAATNTTNRLYDNDALVAQNTRIDLAPYQLVTIRTQPYLMAGPNNVKLVINADSAKPSIGWVRVNVSGTCSTPPVAPSVVVVKFGPGSAEWNTLYTAWGYSNYATTQLRTKGYARYADLVTLNANLTTVVAAKTVEQAAYNTLMARWNSFANDAAFKAATAAIVPGTPGKK